MSFCGSRWAELHAYLVWLHGHTAADVITTRTTIAVIQTRGRRVCVDRHTATTLWRRMGEHELLWVWHLLANLEDSSFTVQPVQKLTLYLHTFLSDMQER